MFKGKMKKISLFFAAKQGAVLPRQQNFFKLKRDFFSYAGTLL
jgi:hypothetical protein